MYTISAPNGNSVTVPILDKCQACDDDPPHIDLTAGTFQALGYDLDQGVIRAVTFGPAISCWLVQAQGTLTGLFVKLCRGKLSDTHAAVRPQS